MILVSSDAPRFLRPIAGFRSSHTRYLKPFPTERTSEIVGVESHRKTRSFDTPL